MVRVSALCVAFQACMFWHSMGFAQDEPIRGQIPPEGTWIKYELSVTNLRNNDPLLEGDTLHEITLKVLGSELRDGEQCRWFEFEVEPTDAPIFDAGLEQLISKPFVVKFLVSEAGLKQSDQRVRLLDGMGRVEDEIAQRAEFDDDAQRLGAVVAQSISLLDELLITADPLPESLIPPLVQFHSLQAADVDQQLETQFGELPAAALAIRSREQRPIATAKGMQDGYLVKVSVWGHEGDWWTPELELVPDVPFGIQSIKFVFRFPENLFDANSKIVDVAAFQLKAVDFGDGAESLLPEIE